MKKSVYSLALLFICAYLNTINAQISGTVFRDYNSNGIKENNSTYIEPGIGGITITIFDSAGGSIGSVVSCSGNNFPNSSCSPSNLGYYEIFVPTGNYRVEFTWSENYLFSGASGGTSVQFVTAPATNVNFGVNNPSHFSQSAANQEVVTPRFCYGYYNSSNFGTTPAIIGVPYNSQDPTSNIGIQNPAVIPSTPYALFNQVGTTMGLAWQRTTNSLYTGAFMHRHSGFGPGGTGGIYIIDKDLPINDPNKVKVYADLNAIFGANTAGVDPHPQTQGGNWFNDVRDPTNTASWVESWNNVGKIALGDVEISDDETTLYTVNLSDRQLYVLPANPFLAGTLTSAQIQRYPIPLNWCVDNTASNTTDDSRPFALKYYDGKLYVGVTCTAESVGQYNVADVGVAIYEFTGTGFSAQPVFTIDGVNFTSPNGGALLFSWTPWTWGVSGTGFNPNAFRQFWLTDIEIDNGDLQLGVRDRWGDLVHFAAGLPTPASPGLTPANNTQATTMGKSFRACLDRNDGDNDGNRNEWILENAGQCGGLSGAGNPTPIAWVPGPGGTIFYHEYASHAYPGTGGLLQLPGFLEVVETTMGPTGLNSGGINWMNNFGTFTGQNTRGGVATPVGATLYNGQSSWTGGVPSNPNPWYKSAGLGDVEAFSDLPPIEIGNRVWMDTDNDGVQDADEMGLDNITVKLFNGTNLVSTKSTTNGGQYYFNTADGVLPNTTYTIRIEAASFPSNKFVTLKDQPTGGVQDLGDNDASLVAGNADITYTTGNPGENNHTFDFGFSSIASAGDCYAVADNGNNPQLYRIDCMTGVATYIGPLAVAQDVEAIELSPSYTNLYGIAAQAGLPAAFGSIDKTTGTWTQIGLIGTADGAQGTISPVEMDGMTHDEFGNMWTISNSPETAVLFKIDTTTGAIVQNTFGTGIDYIKLTGAAANMSVEDMAYDVTTGKYYIVGNGTGGTPDSKLYEINVATGVTTLVADFVQCNEDIEGLTVTPSGELKGTSGNGGNGGPDNPACMDRFYHLTFTGGVTEVSEIDPTNTHNDFEAMTCPGAPLNLVTCEISNISAIPGNCNPVNNQYSLTGSVTFTNPPSTGSLTVSVSGGGSQTFTPPFTSPLNYSIAGLVADGASHTVTVSFSADASCTNTTTYTAPNNCTPNPCVISLTATPGLCNSSTNQYTLTGTLTFSNAPTSGTMTVSVSGGGSQTFTAPFTSPLNYSIAGLVADGASHTVTVSFSADASCTNTATYNAPASCGCDNTPLPLCPGESYTLTAQAGYQNYQWYTVVGATETPIAGAMNQTYVVTATGIYKWRATDGNACPVNACCQYDFQAINCATCTIDISMSPGSCNPSTGRYTLNGQVTFSTPPATGSLVVKTGVDSVIVALPQTSPYIYTITNLLADGNVHNIEAYFTAEPSCKVMDVFTAPSPCLQPKPPCSITANVVVNGCNSNGTLGNSVDDYFTITVTATAIEGGGANKYVVAVGTINPLTGAGGNVLNPGGTTYGTAVVLGTSGQLVADGTSTYDLSIRDSQKRNCFQKVTVGPVQSCSPLDPKCVPTLCIPIQAVKN